MKKIQILSTMIIIIFLFIPHTIYLHESLFNICFNKLNIYSSYIQSIGSRSLKTWLPKFIKLNLIAFKINSFYKLNIYLLLFLFICIISSIIIRTNLINEDILVAYINHYYIKIIINILTILAIIYSLKLIFDIIIKGIQALKIIPEFIILYRSNVINIKSIISLYYLQNIILILLSSWILYNIFIKLNLFIDIYKYIISFGIVSSLIFIHYYPLKGFHFDQNIKNYSLWVYLILLFFVLFYYFTFNYC